MNRISIRKQLTGAGPFLVRTSDEREFVVPHGEFVWVSPSHVYIEDKDGGVNIVDPLHVVSIRPTSRRNSKPSTSKLYRLPG